MKGGDIVRFQPMSYYTNSYLNQHLAIISKAHSYIFITKLKTFKFYEA